MPNLFASAAGRIVAVDGNDGVIPLGLLVGDFKKTGGMKALLTGMSLTGQSGLQVRHSLRQYIQIYTFGERVGEVTVSGLAFVADCQDGAVTNNGNVTLNPVLSSPTGLARIYNWYQRRRVSTTGAPVTLTLTPGLAVNGFLTGFRFEIVDAPVSIGQFAFNFLYPPTIVPPNAAPIVLDETVKFKIRRISSPDMLPSYRDVLGL